MGCLLNSKAVVICFIKTPLLYQNLRKSSTKVKLVRLKNSVFMHNLEHVSHSYST